MKERAIEHMNSDHHDTVVAFCKRFGSFKDVSNVKLTDMNEDGLIITCDQGEVFAPFLQKASDGNYKDAIMTLYRSIDVGNGLEKIEAGMVDFVDSLKTVVISSVHQDMQCVGSYAPFVKIDDAIYICLSSVAEHYHSIKANPNKISLLFIEDESTAKTIFARHRLSIKGEAKFIEDEALRNEIFDKLAEKNPKESAIKQLRNMSDFYIIKVELKDGRYVKGFGAAYNSKGLKLSQAAGESNPHRKNPHGHNPHGHNPHNPHQK
ncbi:HugZ family heme oxygenase [Campylobacter sp. RM16192]|uniref:HugZ family heme oxygenase n=1 Tax=Campylobacter sp. RM16192 TaxID=1660080 RepID=UPI0014528D67|nr:HugZ family heme oxygenase [Campylobacter sp. RM16192]QCD52189.1 iron-responsive cellular heme oxygenase [Campylobacter sp. RM16192]